MFIGFAYSGLVASYCVFSRKKKSFSVRFVFWGEGGLNFLKFYLEFFKIVLGMQEFLLRFFDCVIVFNF